MSNEPRPLTVVRSDPTGQTEAELATVETQDDTIVMRLDDGHSIQIDRRELRAAIDDVPRAAEPS